MSKSRKLLRLSKKFYLLAENILVSQDFSLAVIICRYALSKNGLKLLFVSTCNIAPDDQYMNTMNAPGAAPQG